jgi:hypothetical protein
MPEMAENILLSNGTGRIAAIGHNQQMLQVFLGLLLAAAVAWIFLSNRLYAELRQNYPGLYETLGSPRFFYA